MPESDGLEVYIRFESIQQLAMVSRDDNQDDIEIIGPKMFGKCLSRERGLDEVLPGQSRPNRLGVGGQIYIGSGGHGSDGEQVSVRIANHVIETRGNATLQSSERSQDANSARPTNGNRLKSDDRFLQSRTPDWHGTLATVYTLAARGSHVHVIICLLV
jgi:hypothetical protein